jgi:serine protease Do
MKIYSNKNKNNAVRYLIISAAFLLLFAVRAPAFEELDSSIDTLRQMGKAFASVAEKASPAVVALKAKRTVTQEYQTFRDSPFGNPFSDPFGDGFFDDLFRRRTPRPRQPQRRYQQTAQGSGFIISSDGYIITNNHLVGDAEKVVVELADGREFTATAENIKTDPDTDVALVKIDAKDLPHLELADSDKLEVGEWVLAIGNPLGLSHTVTAGIVSAKGRTGFRLATYENFIQTDAAINFGNSGGPLINLDAKVVGINTAIVGATGNIGIGFAIPINMAKRVSDQLAKSGTVERGFLGVLPQDLDREMAKAFGLENGKGVLIPEVTKDSAADKAGVRHNDVILELAGEPVESADAFRSSIAMFKPGTKIDLVVWRDGKRKTITVKLEKRPSEEELERTMPGKTVEQLGFSVQNLTDELAERYGYEGQSGVIVNRVEPGSQADRVNIVPGALIKEVNRQEVKNTKEFNAAIEGAKMKGNVLLLVKIERATFFALLSLSEE